MMTRIDALSRCLKHLDFGAKHGDKLDEEAADTIRRMIDIMEMQRIKEAWHRWNAGFSKNRIQK